MKRLNNSNMYRCLTTKVVNQDKNNKSYFEYHLVWLRVLCKMSFD